MTFTIIRNVFLSSLFVSFYSGAALAEMRPNFSAIYSNFRDIDSITICMAAMNLESTRADRSKNRAQISYANMMVEKSIYVATIMIKTRGLSVDAIKKKVHFYSVAAEHETSANYERCRGRLNSSVTEVTTIDPNRDPRDIFNQRHR